MNWLKALVYRLWSGLKVGYNFFIIPPKRWRLPNKSDIVVYDIASLEVLLPYIFLYSYECISMGVEFIIVPLVLRTIFKPSFWKGKLIEAYTDCFIQAVNPKIVLTIIDNDIAFYSISKRFPLVKTIFVQNGCRGKIMDNFSIIYKSNNYYVDYMFVLNNAIGSYYKKFISGQVMVTGSIKNNHIALLDADDEPGILFISQYDKEPVNNNPMCIDADGKPIYWSTFHGVDAQVVSFLNTWCSENNKVLRICGRTSDKEGLESAFFAKWITSAQWTFSPLSDTFSTYKLLDSAEMVVVIESTVGFEALARGKKTAFFSCRGAIINVDAFKFGWPIEFPDTGPFWTNIADEKEFKRILGFLNIASNDEWESTRKLYATDLMAFEPGNGKFVALLEQLLGTDVA